MADRLQGRVCWFDVKKGYGFIRSGDKEYFVHYSKILAEPGEFRLLNENEIVEFEPVQVDRGSGTSKWQAKDVQVLRGDNNEIIGKDTNNSVGRRSQRAKTDTAQ